ncbi:sulfatase [Thalassoroseus pseudoceratinae]|uniref:sulfatase n=1 Tax=Thalassoroseus pseudoceratinae TaxID=2713176 RepID=UPI00142243DA|nr:sulfatase [Thalassoroseus pseudoceratinae]
MQRFIHHSLLLVIGLAYLPATLQAADHPNVLLLCIDDLRPELGCYGVDYIQSPRIDALAKKGRIFTKHYVQAPTCGASRFALLTGTYGSYGNNALFKRSRELRSGAESVPPSFPAWFKTHGYRTVSVGKVSHHPGGRGGSNWDDDSQPEMPNSWDRHLMPCGDWEHPRGAMHGLAHGEIRKNAKEMDVFQSKPGSDDIYPDGLITAEALHQLDDLAKDTAETPFFLAVGIIRPHLPFGAPAKYFEPYRDAVLPAIEHPSKPTGKTTWHGSGEFMKYNRWKRNPNTDAEFATEVRKHYAACVTYADTLVGRILDRLDQLKQRENTIVVLWGDHGWHLGEQAVWGKHTLFEESLRSPLIVSFDGMDDPGESSSAIVETIDIFPTVCELASIPRPNGIDGQSLVPNINDPKKQGTEAVSYGSRATTIRTPTHRMVLHRNGYAELYDHRTPAGETVNIAEREPETVQRLTEKLHSKRSFPRN